MFCVRLGQTSSGGTQLSQRAGQAGHKECPRRPGRGMAQQRPRLNDQAAQGCGWTGLDRLSWPAWSGPACMAALPVENTGSGTSSLV